MISICIPPFVHAPITIAAAQVGKHVYCEKPMAMTAMAAKTMCDACNQADVKLGYQSGGRVLEEPVMLYAITSLLERLVMCIMDV